MKFRTGKPVIQCPVIRDQEHPFGVFIQADGSVIVEGDTGFDEDESDAYTGVNRLWDAINTYANKKVQPTEGGDSLMCNNVFYLQAGANYFVEGKVVIKKDCTIAALDPKGDYPWISPIQDATGKTQSDMLRFEANVIFDGIYFFAKDDKGTLQQRMLRIDGTKCKLTLNHCFADYTRNFFIRSDGKDNSVHLMNSTFRNMNYNNSSNGRLVDSRGNAMDEIIIENCLHYNCLGHIIRDDGAIIKNIEVRNNTFYNIGTVFSLDYPLNVTVENNIFANVGWRQCAKSLVPDETTGLVEPECLFELDSLSTENLANAKIVIRNNNIYNTQEMKDMYAKYKTTAKEPDVLSPGALFNQKNGKLTYEGNISEVLSFTNPCPINWEFMDKHFENPDREEGDFANLDWTHDEDGKLGVKKGKVYDFTYPSSAKSATASTTKGKLGAQL